MDEYKVEVKYTTYLETLMYTLRGLVMAAEYTARYMDRPPMGPEDEPNATLYEATASILSAAVPIADTCVRGLMQEYPELNT